MKYKIINTKTNEFHICEKVTINGYHYYVSKSDIEIGDYFEVNGELFRCLTSKEADDLAVTNCYPKVIATNNPVLNLPMVVRLEKKYTIDDMIEFAEWCDTSKEAAHFWRQNRTTPSMDGSHHEINKQNRKKLFELWNQNRIIKIFV